MSTAVVNSPAINNAQVAQNVVSLPKTYYAQKGLLVLTVACAILSLIPPLRLAGALALRGTALLASGVNVLDAWKKEGILGRIADITKVAIVALGIVALAASSPILIIASLAADIGLQTFEFFRAIYNKDVTKALCSLGVIVIDALTLGAIAAGSWQLMVAAAATSAAFMGALAIKAIYMAETKNPLEVLDAICYVALTAVGIASVITTTKLIYHVAKNTHFEIRNNYNYEMRLYDKDDFLVAILKPGESKVLDLNPSRLLNARDLTVKYFGPNGIIILENCQVWNPETNTYQTVIVTSGIRRGDLQRVIVEIPPLPSEKFPTVPVAAGTNIVTKDLG